MDRVQEDRFRIAGILWAFDPLRLRQFRQSNEYDSYAESIQLIRDRETVRVTLVVNGIFEEPMFEQLCSYLDV